MDFGTVGTSFILFLSFDFNCLVKDDPKKSTTAVSDSEHTMETFMSTDATPFSSPTSIPSPLTTSIISTSGAIISGSITNTFRITTVPGAPSRTTTVQPTRTASSSSSESSDSPTRLSTSVIAGITVAVFLLSIIGIVYCIRRRALKKSFKLAQAAEGGLTREEWDRRLSEEWDRNYEHEREYEDRANIERREWRAQRRSEGKGIWDLFRRRTNLRSAGLGASAGGNIMPASATRHRDGDNPHEMGTLIASPETRRAGSRDFTQAVRRSPAMTAHSESHSTASAVPRQLRRNIDPEMGTYSDNNVENSVMDQQREDVQEPVREGTRGTRIARLDAPVDEAGAPPAYTAGRADDGEGLPRYGDESTIVVEPTVPVVSDMEDETSRRSV